MKDLFKKIKEYRYKKRLKKWFNVNIKLIIRRIRRGFNAKSIRSALSSVPAVMTYVSIFAIAAVSVTAVLFAKYSAPYFNSEQKIIRRLKMPEEQSTAPYLTALRALGSSNRIQITLKTDTENYINPRGASLEKGGVNMLLTFSDGTSTEFSLSNANYDTFESGMTDTFTLILPFGYTPFDIIDYTVTVVPDINNNYGSWHCKWVRAYFLLGDQPVMLAKEDWDDCAVFGSGDGAVTRSSLEIVHGSNDSYIRTQNLYTHYLSLAKAGMIDFADSEVKADVLDSLALNAGKTLYLDIETVNIDMQNTVFTYYTKGVDLDEQDSLDYDGLMYLDVTFYSPLSDGGFTKSYLLDTLGTDDFELGTTSSFQLEMPEGMCVFDISEIKLYTDNPYDSWAPRYIRAYLKTDYQSTLEIARISDTMLINDYSTPVFYKNLIDSGISFDLTSKFCLSSVVRSQLESKNHITFSGNIEKMYFELQSFYDRQNMFFKQMLDIYSPAAYESETDTSNPPSTDTQQETEDDTAAPDETVTKEPEQTNTQTQQPSEDSTDSKQTQNTEDTTTQDQPVQTPEANTVTEQTQTDSSQQQPTEEPTSDSADNVPTEESTQNSTAQQQTDTQEPAL